jgi:predicted amidohydrolase YtcJ
MLGLYAAAARRDAQGKPAGGWRPEEKLSRAEAVALFTTGAAWAAFEEASRGRIAEGFDADLTVLSDDLCGGGSDSGLETGPPWSRRLRAGAER